MNEYTSAKKNDIEAKSEQLVPSVSWEQANVLWLSQQNMNLHLFRSKFILSFLL